MSNSDKARMQLAGRSCVKSREAYENTDEEEYNERIEDDDIVTEDGGNTFYQNGRLYARGEAELKKKMDQDKFWPNIWNVSDHGNVSHYTL